MEPTLAFNTISSFMTNTNLQHYSGETGLSYFSQMFVITFLQFVTAATGMAACIATIRGLAGNRLTTLGNFYVDCTRATVRVLLPLALLVATVVLWQGTPMTFEGAAHATTLEGPEQVIARGVAAPEVAIKQLGTNGGGYFGPNSAHPYENPTPLTQLRRDLVDHHHPDGDGLDARLHGRPAEAGGRRLRAPCSPSTCRWSPSPSARSSAAIRPSPPWASISRPARWRARRSASAPACRRSGR